MPLISIEVTADIAQKIRALADAGVFAIKTGNAQCNFVNGEIKSIKTEFYSYPQVTSHETTTVIHAKMIA